MLVEMCLALSPQALRSHGHGGGPAAAPLSKAPVFRTFSNTRISSRCYIKEATAEKLGCLPTLLSTLHSCAVMHMPWDSSVFPFQGAGLPFHPIIPLASYVSPPYDLPTAKSQCVATASGAVTGLHLSKGHST